MHLMLRWVAWSEWVFLGWLWICFGWMFWMMGWWRWPGPGELAKDLTMACRLSHESISQWWSQLWPLQQLRTPTGSSSLAIWNALGNVVRDRRCAGAVRVYPIISAFYGVNFLKPKPLFNWNESRPGHTKKRNPSRITYAVHPLGCPKSPLRKGEEHSSTAATNLKKASRLLRRKILFFTPRPDNPTSSSSSSSSILKGLAWKKKK